MRTVRRRTRPGLLDGSSSPFEDVSHPWVVQALLVVSLVSSIAVLGYHLRSTQRTWQVHPWNQGQARQRHGREVIILIDSTHTPSSHDLREGIRKSWLQWSDQFALRIECRFLIPECPLTDPECNSLHQEHALHRDLLFTQHSPGSQRILEIYRWIAEHVDTHLQWIIHTNDRTFLRLDHILDELAQEYSIALTEEPPLPRDAIPSGLKSQTERFWHLTGLKKNVLPTFTTRELRGFVWFNGSLPLWGGTQIPYCDGSTFLLSGEIYRHLYHAQDWLNHELGEREELVLAAWLFGLNVRLIHDPRMTVQAEVCFEEMWSLGSVLNREEMERLYLLSQSYNVHLCQETDPELCVLGTPSCMAWEGIQCSQSGCAPSKI